ncbi:MAG: DMT family transporter [Hyphomicrobiaceae bacterium]|nr:DMT family transporter [Hyphomicrobiaceae bacterium]
MQQAWIWLAIFAAAMQAVRTAAQKRLTDRVSIFAATYVRSLAGLPVMLAYLSIIAWLRPGLPRPDTEFFGWCVVAAVTQNLGTAALLSLYRRRNFAVANQFARTNLIFTALLGTAFFSELIHPWGWVAMCMALLGALLLSAPHQSSNVGTSVRRGWLIHIDTQSIAIGLFVGFMFGLCNLTIREASLSLVGADALQRGAVTVVGVTWLQVVMLGAWLAWREPDFISSIWSARRLSGLVGLTSAVGSIAWFLAFTLTNASYVLAVGQIEAVFSILISWIYFRERLSPLDLIGIATVIAGVLLFRLAG